MRYSVRDGAFETNSSSVHVIIIPRVGKIHRTQSWKDFTIPDNNLFEWEYNTYTCPTDKLRYLWAAIFDLAFEIKGLDEDPEWYKETSWYFPKDFRELYRRFKGKPNDFLGLWKKRLRDVVGFNGSFGKYASLDGYDGYVSQLSYVGCGVNHPEDLAKPLSDLEKDDDLLIHLIYSYDAEIQTGNDNDEQELPDYLQGKIDWLPRDYTGDVYVFTKGC